MNDEKNNAEQSALAPQLSETTALSAVFFDLDGTLLDTEKPWLDTVRHTLRTFGSTPSEAELLEFEGATVEQAASRILRDHLDGTLPNGISSLSQLGETLETAALHTQSSTPLWCPGARSLIARLTAEEIPLVLVTSSSRRWLNTLAEHLGLEHFAHVITADDVAETKPHPSPYLKAAALIGADPSRCIVFEDSEVGMRSALGAGCTTVLVRADEAPWGADAHHVLSSLVGLSVTRIRSFATASLLISNSPLPGKTSPDPIPSHSITTI